MSVHELSLKNIFKFGNRSCLRNFFLMFSVTHQVPSLIQSLVKMIGQIRDQVRLGQLRRAKHQARTLLRLLSKSSQIKWPELRTEPAAKCRFLRSRIAHMKKFLARTSLTANEFHQFKKDFRLVYAIYYSLNRKEALLPTSANALLVAKKVIKRMHQVLLEQKYEYGLKYRETAISLQTKFRQHLLRCLGAIKVTSPRPKELRISSIPALG
jgi:hypothetical protein